MYRVLVLVNARWVRVCRCNSETCACGLADNWYWLGHTVRVEKAGRGR
jgi:hypothetical protein